MYTIQPYSVVKNVMIKITVRVDATQIFVVVSVLHMHDVVNLSEFTYYRTFR